ncbi:hypothetical protein CVT26_006771 [Gymnopilus dilepis]|uniref:Uncharacterized protein n=1 Tax=Gymnopilus dilepis TaxID=231916 RepID=A0A409W6L7_9AGAR|nr:hypothetical protein CVT26_006771 [Gymnopilus dilepis]
MVAHLLLDPSSRHSPFSRRALASIGPVDERLCPQVLFETPSQDEVKLKTKKEPNLPTQKIKKEPVPPKTRREDLGPAQWRDADPDLGPSSELQRRGDHDTLLAARPWPGWDGIKRWRVRFDISHCALTFGLDEHQAGEPQDEGEELQAQKTKEGRRLTFPLSYRFITYSEAGLGHAHAASQRRTPVRMIHRHVLITATEDRHFDKAMSRRWLWCGTSRPRRSQMAHRVPLIAANPLDT